MGNIWGTPSPSPIPSETAPTNGQNPEPDNLLVVLAQGLAQCDCLGDAAHTIFLYYVTYVFLNKVCRVGLVDIFVIGHLGSHIKGFQLRKRLKKYKCPSVRPSVNKTPKQLKIIHFTLPQHSPPLTTSHTASHSPSQHNITTQHHNTTSQHYITTQHHMTHNITHNITHNVTS